jgi:ATP-dependent Lon protease
MIFMGSGTTPYRLEHVCNTYIWTSPNLDLKRAERILESQHYGLPRVKERILEYLAVRTLCSVQTSQILVVDDEEIARTNLEYILRKEGHQVTTAANGLEALEKVKAQEFDVVLTDLKMEKMDGIQLLESVKQIAPHTEIVMVTGYATVSSAVDALKKGQPTTYPSPSNSMNSGPRCGKSSTKSGTCR